MRHGAKRSSARSSGQSGVVRSALLALGCVAFVPCGAPSAHAQAVTQESAGPGQPRRAYLLDGVYEQPGEIVFQDGAARVQVEADEVVQPANGRFVQLWKRGAKGRSLRLLDETGRLVIRATLPPETSAVASNVGFVSLPDALHAPMRAHRLGFHALDGQLLRQVDEPGLAIVGASVRPDGKVVTVSRLDQPGICAVIVYGPAGDVLRDRRAPCSVHPEVEITPDASRLFLIYPDPAAGRSRLEIVGAANEILSTHALALVLSFAASADSARAAVVTWDEVVLLDAATGAIGWRRPARLRLPPDGLAFAPAGRHLLALDVGPDDTQRRRKLSLHRFDLVDGRQTTRDLGRVPSDSSLGVRAFRTDAQGTLRIVMGDRVMRVPARMVEAP